MARNIGEAMGVGATYDFFDPYGRPIPREERYRASTMVDKMTLIEGTLQKLTPPRWPEDLLGPIDCQKAAQGKNLFEQHCGPCHQPREASDAVKQWEAPGKLVRDARMMRNDEEFGLHHLRDPSSCIIG
jgi:mono/diheme cytochrome c family protein